MIQPETIFGDKETAPNVQVAFQEGAGTYTCMRWVVQYLLLYNLLPFFLTYACICIEVFG